MNLDKKACFFVLFSSVPPRFSKTPNRVITVIRGKEASASCQAFGFPSPKIVWSRGLVPLPQGRTSVSGGTLVISRFELKDSGTYQCTASNKLGSVSALTTLYYINIGMSEYDFVRGDFQELVISPHLRTLL